MSLERLDRYEVATLVTPLRQGQRRYGVAGGGPMDCEAYAHLAEMDDVWELFGVAISHWKVLQAGWVAITGMPKRTFLNDAPISGQTFAVAPGDIVRIEPIVAGQVAYLGYCLTLRKVVPWFGSVESVRVWPSVDEVDQTQLLGHPFTLSLDSNRLGLRIGETIKGFRDLDSSEPTAPGVIQVTPEGRLIILGPDGPTIGGYARIGAVIEADLPLLGRIGFGQPFRFVKADFSTN